MQFVQIRLHGEYDGLKPLLDRLSGESQLAVGFAHVPDSGCSQAHVHYLLGGFKPTKTTFYSWCKEAGLKPSDYYFARTHGRGCGCGCKGKKPVDLSFISYESKGKLEPLPGLKGIRVEEVGEWRARWVDRTVQTQLRFLEESPDGSSSNESVPTKTDTKRSTKKMLLNEMVAYVEKSGDYDDEKIIDVIEMVLKAEGEPIGMYKVLDYRDSILMHVDAHKWKYECLSLINKRYKF